MDLTALIEKRMEHIDVEDIVRAEILSIIGERVRKAIDKILEKAAEQIVGEEISRQLLGPVDTDDGYGKKTHYDTFEDFFRTTFSKQLVNGYTISNLITKRVRELVESAIEKNRAEIANRIVEELKAVSAPKAAS